MSQNKNIKKLKQLARREMRADVQELTKELRADLVGNPPINPKPKFIPRRLWRYLVRKVINQSFIDKWYGVSL